MISVIVPVYNVEQYLNRCIKSIVQQSYKDLEIILVDDGSTDSSGKLCDIWQSKDKRIKVLHKINGGLSDARNTGLEVSNGEYIGFIDSDDWIEPDMYQVMLFELQHAGADLAVTGINRVYDNGYHLSQFIHDKVKCYYADEIIKKYLDQNCFSTAACDKLYKKELLENRRFPVGKLFEDAPIVYDILKSIDKIVVVGKGQYNYFQRANSICGQLFSIKKMDHYEFSKAIWLDVKANYPQYSKEADAFWGCKLCEILYSLKESENRRDYLIEEKLLKRNFKGVWRNVISSRTISRKVKIKAIMAKLHLYMMYIWIKKISVRKG